MAPILRPWTAFRGKGWRRRYRWTERNTLPGNRSSHVGGKKIEMSATMPARGAATRRKPFQSIRSGVITGKRTTEPGTESGRGGGGVGPACSEGCDSRTGTLICGAPQDAQNEVCSSTRLPHRWQILSTSSRYRKREGHGKPPAASGVVALHGVLCIAGADIDQGEL
jgi:hypothetical protein